MAKKTSIKGLYKRVLIKPFYIKLAAFEKAAVLYIKSKRKEKRKDLFFPLFWLDYLSPEIPRLPPGLSAYDTKLFLNIPNKGLRRNLPIYVRGELMLKLKPLISAKAKENLVTHTKNGYKQLCQNSDNPVDTKKELSKLAGVSH